MTVDPTTGRRVSRENPENEWVVSDAPELRIIDEDLAVRVEARRRKMAQSPAVRGRPRTKGVLSGLLFCWACGGPMAVNGTTKGVRYIRCSRVTEAGTCTSKKRVRLDQVEATVLAAMLQHFWNPAHLQERVDLFLADRQKGVAEARRDIDKHEKRLADLNRSIARVVDQIADGTIEAEDARPRMKALRTEREEIKVLIAQASAEAASVELHPETIRRYFLNLKAFQDLVEKATVDRESPKAETIRGLIGRVIVKPGPPYVNATVEIEGKLGPMLERPYVEDQTVVIQKPNQPMPHSNLKELGLIMVAGGRIELPTSGL